MSALDELHREVAGLSEVHWRSETYDMGVVGSLTEPERDVAVPMLIGRAEQGDVRAVMTLGHMGAQQAVAPLQALALLGVPWANTVRRALVLLGHGLDVVDAIAWDALHHPSTMARAAALLDLKTLGGPVATATFDAALDDRDDAVRTIAWEGLMKALDLERFMAGPSGALEKCSVLELLRDFMLSDVSALVTIGRDELRALLRRLRDGASPESVGSDDEDANGGNMDLLQRHQDGTLSHTDGRAREATRSTPPWRRSTERARTTTPWSWCRARPLARTSRQPIMRLWSSS